MSLLYSIDKGVSTTRVVERSSTVGPAISDKQPSYGARIFAACFINTGGWRDRDLRIYLNIRLREALI